MRKITITSTSLATLAALALLAGCGGSTDPGVAHLGTTAASSSAAAAGGNGESGGGSGAGQEGGGSSSGGAGQEGGEASVAGGGPQAQKRMVAYSQCMRTHGVPNFPEPQEGKLIVRGGRGGLNPGSPQFQSAQKACAHLMPQGTVSPAQSAEFQAKALKFSQCMRSHGVPNFPDPKVEGGGVRLALRAGPGGINPRSPQFQAAQKACQGDMPLPKGGPGGPVAFGPKGP